MSRKTTLSCCAVLVLIFIQTPAAGLTVEEAVRMALERNLGLQAERISLVTRERTNSTAWNFLVPDVSASTRLFRPNEDPADTPSFPGEPEPPRWNLSVALQARLDLNAALYHAIRQTVFDLQSGKIEVETAEKQLARDVRKSFYNLLLQQENIALMQQNIDAAEDRYEQSLANYNAGLVSEYTLLASQVALENLRPDLEDMRLGYRTSLMSFKQTIGIPREETIELDGAIEAPVVNLETERFVQRYVGRRLDVRALEAGLEGLENQRKVTVARQMTPTLSLSYTADPTFQDDPFAGSLFDDLENEWQQSPAGGFAVTLSVPLDVFLPASQARTEVAGIEDEIRRSELLLQQTREAAALEIDNIVSGLRKSLTSIRALELNVELADRAYRLAEEAYNAGTQELLEVQNAELELRQAQVNVLREKYAYVTGLLDLEYALNTRLEELE